MTVEFFTGMCTLHVYNYGLQNIFFWNWRPVSVLKLHFDLPTGNFAISSMPDMFLDKKYMSNR